MSWESDSVERHKALLRFLGYSFSLAKNNISFCGLEDSVDVEHWVSARLKSLEEGDFCLTSHRKVPPTCVKSTKVKHFRVPLAGGTGSAILISPRNSEDCKNVLVLNFHGLGDDSTFPFWHWAETLVKSGLSVLSVDWDGHGVGSLSNLDFQAATRSLPLILQKLYGQKGLSNFVSVPDGPHCFLMGYSVGAVMALLAASRPDVARFARGVIAISPLLVMGKGRRDLTESGAMLRPLSWGRELFSKVKYYGFSGVFRKRAEMGEEGFPVRTVLGLDCVEQLKSFLNETFVTRRVLKNVSVPVLWIHGAKDRIVPLEKVQGLMTDIPSALFIHLDNRRGHFLTAFSGRLPQYVGNFVSTVVEVSSKAEKGEWATVAR